MPDRHTANPTAPGVSTKRQIETQLHAKLETAKTGYESVSEAHQLTLKHCEELRLKNHLDGNGNGHQAPYVGTSISQTGKAQRDAFEKYRRALDEFNRFILYGELPE
jgi:hypothetical protein